MAAATDRAADLEIEVHEGIGGRNHTVRRQWRDRARGGKEASRADRTTAGNRTSHCDSQCVLNEVEEGTGDERDSHDAREQ
jgi:hypothetical protein